MYIEKRGIKGKKSAVAGRQATNPQLNDFRGLVLLLKRRVIRRKWEKARKEKRREVSNRS